MIYIKISDMDFYDDAVVLIKSFYPRTEVMQYQEQGRADTHSTGYCD